MRNVIIYSERLINVQRHSATASLRISFWHITVKYLYVLVYIYFVPQTLFTFYRL